VTSRGKMRSRAVRLVAMGAAGAATVALTQVTASGAFSGAAGNTVNSVSSAPTFCTAAPKTLYSSGDAWIDETSGFTDTNHQNDLDLHVRSSSGGDRRVWIGFSLVPDPNPDPAHCQLKTATLTLYNRAPSLGRNIDVYRGNPTSRIWTAADVTWTNQPVNPLGPAVTNAMTTGVAGPQQWVVTDFVAAQYASGNNGFLLRDRNEGSGTPSEQLYYDRQNGSNSPTLVLTWG
jgi:hypothetical protein